jgi:hypothetical protein
MMLTLGLEVLRREWDILYGFRVQAVKAESFSCADDGTLGGGSGPVSG